METCHCSELDHDLKGVYPRDTSSVLTMNEQGSSGEAGAVSLMGSGHHVTQWRVCDWTLGVTQGLVLRGQGY